MSHPADSSAMRLLQFNAAVLAQAFPLLAAHRQAGAPAYAYPVGAHLRHVIEHYEALLMPKQPGVVDYDQRPRDRALQMSASVALLRLQLLLRQLGRWSHARLDAPVQVRGRSGLEGELDFAVTSSVARELAFVASHAIHHYALLKPYCTQHGIAVGAAFGRAPSTVAHEAACAANRLAA
jgi:hypothetical protein